MKKSQTLFSQTNLENINFVLEDKMEILEKNIDYQKITNELNTIQEELESSLSKEDAEKLNRITYLYGEMELYTNTLAYFLGIKFGEDISSL